MQEDLSTIHKPIGTMFPQLTDLADASQLELTQSQLEFYNEHGYVSGIKILSDTQCDYLLAELDQIMDPQHRSNHLFHEFHSNESPNPAKVLFHALGAWRISQGFHDLLWNPPFVIPASQLVDGAVRFWHDQLFCKPAFHGGVVAWHQDYSYWTRTVPMSHLTCWIGLDDATRDNGCLHYVPGSHRWKLLPITGLAGDMNDIHSVLTEEMKAGFKPVPIELKRGEAAFHHPLMIHGSFENRTSIPRRAAVLNVFRDGVRSASAAPLLDGVPSIPEGELVQGTFFPLLHEPNPISA